MLPELLQSLGPSAGSTPPAAAWSIVTLITRLAIDLACVGVLVAVYLRHYRRTSLILTFLTCNVVIFMITFSMNTAQMSMGAAFGLFAVFSMLRYRTEGISAKDMTYLFLVIALGLIMAVGSADPVVLLSIGGGMVALTALLESNLVVRREHAQSVVYDKLELLHPGERDALFRDLQTRTGLQVHRTEIEEIDLLRDTARVTIYYFAS